MVHNDCDGGSCWACANEEREKTPMTTNTKRETIAREEAMAKLLEADGELYGNVSLKSRLVSAILSYPPETMTEAEHKADELLVHIAAALPDTPEGGEVELAYKDGFEDAKDAHFSARDVEWEEAFAQSKTKRLSATPAPNTSGLVEEIEKCLHVLELKEDGIESEVWAYLHIKYGWVVTKYVEQPISRPSEDVND